MFHATVNAQEDLTRGPKVYLEHIMLADNKLI